MKLLHIFLSFFVTAAIGHSSDKRIYSNTSESSLTLSDQFLICYDGDDFAGPNVVFHDYAPDLAVYNWDNRFSSCCFYGVWLLYDDVDYNEDDFQAEEFDAWGELYCTSFSSRFDNLATSLRFAGAPNGYQFSTLNLYDGERFMGAEQFYYDYDDASRLDMDNVMRSAIVTGCDPWTIYRYDDYRGDAVCLFPSDLQNCYPGFFPFSEDLKGMANAGSSARVGCYSNNKIIGKSFKEVMMRAN